MGALEITLLVLSILAIAGVFVAELVRHLRARTTKLTGPQMLAVRITLGVIFIILGIIGGFVPILQGWVFMLLAALVLFPQSRFAISALDNIELKMPRVVKWLRRLGIGEHDERGTIRRDDEDVRPELLRPLVSQSSDARELPRGSAEEGRSGDRRH